MHPTDLWDFDDPSGSEARFRDAADAAAGEERLLLLTQVARALGLQQRYDDAHLVLDDVASSDSRASSEVVTRVLLERGRLHRSSGNPDEAISWFGEASTTAYRAGLEELQVDALHMYALCSSPVHQLEVNERALAIARAATDPRARDWDASLLNNIGMTHADADDWSAALLSFEEALAARERIGDAARTRVARWMVAWALRNLGRTDEALTLQRELKADLDAIGEVDPFVDEEIALLMQR